MAFASYTAIRTFDQATAGFYDAQNDPTWFFTVAFLLLPLGWLVILWFNGAYDRRYLGLGPDEFKRVIRAGVAVCAAVSFIAFATKTDLSRFTVGTALLMALLLILLGRILARFVLHVVRRNIQQAAHRMVLVGTLPECLEVYTAVTRNPSAGLVPVAIHLTDGYAAAKGRADPGPGVRRPRRPGPGAGGRRRHHRGLRLGQRRAGRAAPARLAAGGLRRRPGGGSAADRHRRAPGAHPPDRGPAAAARRGTDPVRAGAAGQEPDGPGRRRARPAAAVPGLRRHRHRDPDLRPGPVFFRQPRVGHEGRTFRVWKFRTMYVDAEDRLASLVDQNETDGMLFKMKQDPRVFPVGRFLRASSLDELPQLINVLKGEMSLVGPRPLPADDGDFLGDVRRRLLVRPGMTGLWQVSGRSDLSWDEAVRLDLYYVDNWSLAYDLSILWRTVGVVLARKGAY